MLSHEEKKEMLKDAKSKRRRNLFRAKNLEEKAAMSLDEYISFLNSVQEIFSPFRTSFRPTPTASNML